MIIQFSPAELNNLSIQFHERRELPAAYLEEREKAWNSQMEKVLARNGHMWNGEVYTLEDIFSPAENQVILGVSTCEYKDLIFRMLKGPEYVATQFGEDSLFRFAGVSCVPLTRDGKYVFGIRADRPEQGQPPVGCIGGTLNRDEMEIHSFADIRQSMLREIEEETALDCAAEQLKFCGLNGDISTYLFLFTVRLAIDSRDLQRYNRPGEFSELVAMTGQEAQEPSSPTTWAYRRWQPYLPSIASILDQANTGRLFES